MRPNRLACAALIVLIMTTSAAYAGEPFIRHGFWGGLDLGAGLLQRSFDEAETEDTTFYLGFKGGYTVNPHLRIGLELSGWLLEASNLEDPAVGEGLSQIFVITRLYPSKQSNLFAKVGGGYVSQYNNRPGESSGQNGWGLTVGGGYDIPVKENFALSPFVSFSFGDLGDLDYKALNFGIGLLFQ